MDAQHPERLQINVYNGSYKASDSTYIAAGIYVPNGDVYLTTASKFVIVGEVLAKNITMTQNNDGVHFFGKSTSSRGAAKQVLFADAAGVGSQDQRGQSGVSRHAA
ncbi:MAG: hypothetical protein IPL70_04325 [Uliginosibacterium sp.]|nr:hypothetical protein [Uliginosibacterium sp.]